MRVADDTRPRAGVPVGSVERGRTGLVAGSLPFSCVDGPGNRFVLFLQGCDFDCRACHNPQTIPLTSVHATELGVDDVLDRLRDAMPYVSGITVSGGEATVQWRFVRDVFARIKVDTRLGDLSTMVDSNGNAPAEVWHALAPVMDGAMIDLKALDPQVHRELTGQPNDAVLGSIRLLSVLGRLAEVRLLLIPGRNDSDADLAAVARWLGGIDPNIPVRLNLFATHGVRAPADRWRAGTPADRERYEAVLTACGTRIVTPS